MDWKITALIATVFLETLGLIHWLGPQRSPLILLIMLPVLMLKSALLMWVEWRGDRLS